VLLMLSIIFYVYLSITIRLIHQLQTPSLNQQ